MNIKAHHQSNEPEPVLTAPTPPLGEVVPVAEVKETTVFDWNGYLIRVIMSHGEPWFVLTDLCKVLGVKNPGDVKSRLDPKGIDLIYTLTAGGKQQVVVVNEPAMYDVVFRSDKPEAKAFRDWVFYEVLPQIRKTGMYLPDRAADPYSVMRATNSQLRAVIDQLEAVDRTATEAKELAVRVGERTELVEARVDLIMGGHNWLTARAFAQKHRLNRSRARLLPLGRAAADLARANGVEPKLVPSERHGRVNSMPEEFWVAAAKQIGVLAQLDAQAG